MTDHLTPDQKIIYAVGTIVLCCHEIERYLKFFVPFTDSVDPSLRSILARQEKISKRTLGEVTGKFIESMEGDTGAFRIHFRAVVDKRNVLIHHFNSTYGKLIAAKQHAKVLAALEAQHAEAVGTLPILQEMAVSIFEALRDTTFKDTEQYDQLAMLCETARASIAAKSCLAEVACDKRRTAF